jgi:hypothetical protein
MVAHWIPADGTSCILGIVLQLGLWVFGVRRLRRTCGWSWRRVCVDGWGAFVGVEGGNGVDALLVWDLGCVVLMRR